MAYADTSLVSAGISSLPQGLNYAQLPKDLPPSQYSISVNFTNRNNTTSIRPPFKRLNIIYPDQATKAAFDSGVFQGAEGYTFNSGLQRFYEIICSVGGHIYAITLQSDFMVFPGFPAVWGAAPGSQIDGVLREITPPDKNGGVQPNSSKLNRAWFQQAASYMIIQDGQSNAIIYKYGSPAFRANAQGVLAPPLSGATTPVYSTPPQVPVGTIMAYGQGRLTVVLQGNQIVCGDLIGSKYPDPTIPGKVAGDEVIEFTENIFLNEGGYFTVPTEFNEIQGLLYTQVGDTATGQGMMIAGTESAYGSFNTSLDRSTWKNSNFGSITALGTGVFGDRAMVNINSDIWNRSPDGVRSLIQARRGSFQWQNTPQSYEVSPILDNDSQSLLTFASAVYFNRRLLMTVGPYYQDTTVVHQALASMNFDGVSSLIQQTSPCWESFWTGLRISQIFKQFYGSYERCFAFTRGQDGTNQLYEILAQGDFDDQCQPIPAFLDTRGFDLGNPDATSELVNGEVWLNNLKGEIDFSAQWRPDYYPCWFDWDGFHTCFNYETCTGQNCTLPNYQPGYWSRQALSEPPELYVAPSPSTCLTPGLANTPESNLASKANIFQFRLLFTGNSGAQISLFKGNFRAKPDVAVANVQNT